MKMLTEVMMACNNFFEYAYKDGTFTVNGGTLEDDAAVTGDFIAIEGSVSVNGAWRNGEIADGESEVFTGRVWYLRPPKSFIKLCEDIATYCDKAPANGVTSESFGNYSRSFASGAHGAVTWQEVFFDRMLLYRRMFTEVSV